jgi:hypothetical protein
MFPFGGFFKGLDKGLSVVAITESVQGGWNDFASAGFRIDLDGDLMRRRKSIYTSLGANTWVHSDSKPLADSTLYETRLFNVDQSGIGDGVWNPHHNDENWYTIQTFDLNTWLFIDGAQFEAFKNGVVTGEYEIREIADTANTVGSTFSFTVSYEGQS